MEKLLIIAVSFIAFAFSQEGAPRKNMQVMMKWQLTEYLDLGEKQAEKFFPKMNDHEKKIKVLNTQIRKLREEVEINISNDTSSRMNNRSNIEKIEKLEKEKIELRTVYLLSLEGILEPNQVSKLMVFEKKFRKTLKEELRKYPRPGIRDEKNKKQPRTK